MNWGPLATQTRVARATHSQRRPAGQMFVGSQGTACSPSYGSAITGGLAILEKIRRTTGEPATARLRIGHYCSLSTVTRSAATRRLSKRGWHTTPLHASD